MTRTCQACKQPASCDFVELNNDRWHIVCFAKRTDLSPRVRKAARDLVAAHLARIDAERRT
jgi:hypothetical protein